MARRIVGLPAEAPVVRTCLGPMGFKALPAIPPTLITPPSTSCATSRDYARPTNEV